jgi:hypothetical protein
MHSNNNDLVGFQTQVEPNAADFRRKSIALAQRIGTASGKGTLLLQAPGESNEGVQADTYEENAEKLRNIQDLINACTKGIPDDTPEDIKGLVDVGGLLTSPLHVVHLCLARIHSIMRS